MQNHGPARPEPTNVFDYFRKAIQIVKLDQPAMVDVARDENALRFGMAVTAIGGALAFIPGDKIEAMVVGALFSVLVLFLFAALVHLFCGYTKEKQEFMSFLRIMAVSGIIDWTVVIPHVGPVITIWSVVVAIVAAAGVYDTTRSKAVVAVVASTVILWMMTLMIFTGPLAHYYEVPAE